MHATIAVSVTIDAGELSRLRRTLRRATAYFGARRPIEGDGTYGVAGNTFRAFRGYDRPSDSFRTWAQRQVESPKFRARISVLTNQRQFDEFHGELSDSLAQTWRQKYGKGLSVAHRFKLIDLMIKWLCQLNVGDEKINENLVQFGHVPLDSRVFAALDRLFFSAFLIEGRSMGHLASIQAYDFWQQLVRTLMSDLNAPALYFDYFAWNHVKLHKRADK